MIDDLITVTFEDATDVDSAEQGLDVVGIPFDHYWGPANTVKKLSRLDFLRLYPEVLPLGVSYPSARAFMHSYSAAKRCFDMGADTLECLRVLPTKYEKYWAIKPTLNTSDNVESKTPNVNSYGWFYKQDPDEGADSTALDKVPFSIHLKYPGLIPSSFGYDKFEVKVTISGNKTLVNNVPPIKIEVIGKNTETVQTTGTDGSITTSEVVTGSTVVESWEGSLDKLAVVDGKTYYIGNVIQGSKWLSVLYSSDSQEVSPLKSEFTYTYEPPAYGTSGPHWSDAVSTPTAGAPSLAPGSQDVNISEELTKEYSDTFVSAYKQSFMDLEASSATILAPALATRTIYATIQEIAQKKKYLTAVVGLPQNSSENYEISDSMIVNNQNAEEFIEAYKNELIQDKFSTLIIGNEILTVFGAYKIISDCTASFIGRTIAVAKSVKINQPASAKQYGNIRNGSVGCVLRSAFSYDTILDLHSKGIGGVYNSAAGPRIWNIKTLHPRQSSYFAKWNVMRTCASILRNIMELSINAVHTATSADPSLRSDFEGKCQAVLDIYAAAGNIKVGSNANVSAELNNDVDTNAGEKLIIELKIIFIKVVEEINIRVIATDSRVTAELT